MARKKHASSRNRPKMGSLPTKKKRAVPLREGGKFGPGRDLASFRLKEGSNKQTQKGNTS